MSLPRRNTHAPSPLPTEVFDPVTVRQSNFASPHANPMTPPSRVLSGQ